MSDPPARAAPLRALVVEDEWLARSYLVELLQESGMASVVAAVGALEQASQVLAADAGVCIDVAFVDVELAGSPGNRAGLDWVRRLATSANAPRVVLATALGKHAVEAFELGVDDYLVKPFTKERVAHCLSRLVAVHRPTREPEGPKRIVARRKRALVFLDLDVVLACEASERLTSVHSTRGQFELDLTLAAIGASFGRSLIRVHRNWLVNLARVLELESHASEATLLVGDPATPIEQALRVPVSRNRAPAVRELLLSNATGVRHL